MNRIMQQLLISQRVHYQLLEILAQQTFISATSIPPSMNKCCVWSLVALVQLLRSRSCIQGLWRNLNERGIRVSSHLWNVRMRMPLFENSMALHFLANPSILAGVALSRSLFNHFLSCQESHPPSRHLHQLGHLLQKLHPLT